MLRNNFFKSGILICLLFSLNSFASYEARQAGMSPERLEKIGPSLSKYITEGRLPGLITAVARKGKIVHFETQGYADVENKIPLQEDSLFRIYSMSKPITGVALMILIEEGKIRLNDPVAIYIPEFARTKVMKAEEDGSFSLVKLNKPITIRDLATHTSGIAYSFTANKQLREIYEEKKLTPYFFIDNMTTLINEEGSFATSTKAFPNVCSFSAALASEAPLMHQPGAQYTYSMGMDILGCVIERASGKTFDVFLKERIFEPLGMKDTFFEVPKDKADRFTSLYASPMGVRRLSPELSDSLAKENKLMVLVDRMDASPYLAKATVFDGGSGLVSSTRDYLTFTQMLVNGGALGKTRILSRKSVELMASNHLSSSVINDSEMSRYISGGTGFGITVGVTTDPGLAGEYGSKGKFYWGGAAATIFWIDPEEELVAVAMTQLLGSPWPLRTDFEALVYAAIDD